MQTVKSLGLMIGAGVMVGGGGMLAMTYLARQALAPTEAPAGAQAARISAGTDEDEVTMAPPAAPALLPDGMPAGPVITPDALQTPPQLSRQRVDGSVDADGTPGFVPQAPEPGSSGPSPDRAQMQPTYTPTAQVQPVAPPAAMTGTLDPKGIDPVPSR